MTLPIKDEIRDIYERLVEYKDSRLEIKGRQRPCIVWSGGETLGMGWASHASGDPGGFKRLGFTGYDDFYTLPKTSRNRFLRAGLKVFFDVIGKDVRRWSDEEALKRYRRLLKRLKDEAKKVKKSTKKRIKIPWEDKTDEELMEGMIL